MTKSRLYRGPGLVAAIVAMGFGLISCSGSPVNSAAPTTTASPVDAALSVTTTSTVPPTTTTVAPTTTTTVAPTTTTTVPKPPSPPTIPTTTVPRVVVPTIGEGNSGTVVLALQQQLSTLGYWLGTPNGTFGNTTQQAVFALQKAANLPRTGVVDATTLAALQAGTKPTAMSTTGHVLEVNLKTDLLMVVDNGVISTIINTSTGGGYVYFDRGVRGVAITPQGHFTTYMEVNGVRVSSLGTLYRPKYFIGGYAIHGDSSVPAHPVSHGCVRVSNAAIDFIWSSGVDPIGTSVWIY